MAILTTQWLGIKYPDKNEPPTISKHLEQIAKDIDASVHAWEVTLRADFTKFSTDEQTKRTEYQTALTTQNNNWQAQTNTTLANINAQLATEGWGTPTTISGTLVTAGTGYTVDTGSRGVKVGNVVAWTYKFHKTTTPAVTAGASGNLNPAIQIGTLTAAMPTPSTITPFSTVEDGFQLMGYIDTAKKIWLTALPPNTNLASPTPMTVGGIYLFNPLVP